MKQYFASFTFKDHPLRYHVSFLLNIKTVKGELSDADKIKVICWNMLKDKHPYLESEKPTAVKIWIEKGTYTDGVFKHGRGVFVCNGIEEVIFNNENDETNTDT